MTASDGEVGRLPGGAGRVPGDVACDPGVECEVDIDGEVERRLGVRAPDVVPVAVGPLPPPPLVPDELPGVVPVMATVRWSSVSTTTTGSSSGRNSPCSSFDSSRLE